VAIEFSGLQRDADHRLLRRSGSSVWKISAARDCDLRADMTAAVIYWVMSLDPTWYSSFMVAVSCGSGYMVLAFSIIVVISLSRGEPFKTILRQTEQHDLGKLTFAFVMLNIYLAFHSI